MPEHPDDLEGFAAALEVPRDPSTEYLELAAKVVEQAQVQTTTQGLLDLATTLVNVVEYFCDGKVRWAIRRAEGSPRGLVAFFVRRRIKAHLPEGLNSDVVARLIISAAAALIR